MVHCCTFHCSFNFFFAHLTQLSLLRWYIWTQFPWSWSQAGFCHIKDKMPGLDGMHASQVFSLTFSRFQAMNIFSLDRNIISFAVAADVVGHQICCFYPYWQIRWRKMMHRRPAEWVKRSTAGRLENYKIAFCILRSNTSLASICIWGKPNYWKQRFLADL